MRIAIVDIEPQFPSMTSQLLMPRHGVLAVGTAVLQAGHSVDVFVECLNGLPSPKDLSRYDVVGAAVTVCNLAQVRELFRQLTAINHKIVCIAGGPHATLVPEDLIDCAHYVIRDEGELTTVELLAAISNKFSLGSVLGISYRDGSGCIVHNPRRSFNRSPGVVDDLTILKSFKRQNWIKQFLANGLYTGYALTSRGCPYPCSFCYENMIGGTGYRTQDIDSVIADIRLKIDFFRVKNFFLANANFGVNKKYAKEVLQAIIDANLDCNFSALCRVDIGDHPDLLILMKRARFKTLVLGMEAIDDSTLESIYKRQNVSAIINAIAAIHGNNMSVYGLFMLGFDGDTADSPRKIVDFCLQHGVDGLNFYLLLEYDSLMGHTLPWWRIAETDTAYYTGHFATTFAKNVRPSVLETHTFDALRQFYSIARVSQSLVRSRLNAACFQGPLYFQARRLSSVSREHVKRLEEIELPYYGADGTLREEYLREHPVVARDRVRRNVGELVAKDTPLYAIG